MSLIISEVEFFPICFEAFCFSVSITWLYVTSIHFSTALLPFNHLLEPCLFVFAAYIFPFHLFLFIFYFTSLFIVLYLDMYKYYIYI